MKQSQIEPVLKKSKSNVSRSGQEIQPCHKSQTQPNDALNNTEDICREETLVRDMATTASKEQEMMQPRNLIESKSAR